MNLERAIKLREQLLNLPGKFDYGHLGRTLQEKGDRVHYSYDVVTAKEHLCNTSACVAGWCIILNSEITEPGLSQADHAAKNYLKLDYAESKFLFFPDNHYAIKLGFKTKDREQLMHNYTLDDAIERLDHLINLEKAKCQPQ